MTGTYDVFISYSRHDADFAIELERALTGLSIYRDQSTIKVGDPWLSDVIEAIYSSRSVIVLLSPDYISSPICRAELFHALGRDPDGRAKIVIPVILHLVELPPAVRLLQYVDATVGRSREDVLRALRSAVQDRLAEPDPPDAPPGIEDARLDLAVDITDDAKTVVRVLRMARRALANLEVRAAGYTSATLPPTLEIELEDKREEVAALDRRLRKIVDTGRHR